MHAIVTNAESFLIALGEIAHWARLGEVARFLDDALAESLAKLRCGEGAYLSFPQIRPIGAYNSQIVSEKQRRPS